MPAWLRGNPSRKELSPAREKAARKVSTGSRSRSIHHTLQETVVRMWEQQEHGPKNPSEYSMAKSQPLGAFLNDTMICMTAMTEFPVPFLHGNLAGA